MVDDIQPPKFKSWEGACLSRRIDLALHSMDLENSFVIFQYSSISPTLQAGCASISLQCLSPGVGVPRNKSQIPPH